MVLLARRQDRLAELRDDSGLPSWLVFDLVSRGFSRVGYMSSLLRDYPEVAHHPDLGLVDLSELAPAGIDLGPVVLKSLNVDGSSGFVFGRLPEYRHNDKLVVAELENAVYGAYLHVGEPSLLKLLDKALKHFSLEHTERWPIHLERARREIAQRQTGARGHELTLTEPLPMSLRVGEGGSKSPELRLVESLVNGYLSYLPKSLKEELRETGCAFVPNMRLLLKQFPQIARDQNVSKIDLFTGPSGRPLNNRRARRLLGLEAHNGWVLIRDARRQIEHNLSETLKARFEATVEARHHRAPTTAEKVMLSTLLNEHGIGCTFDKDNRRSRKLEWKVVFLGSPRQALGRAALEELGMPEDDARPEP